MFACVPGQRLTETLERPLSGDGTQTHQQLPGARETTDPLQGRRDVRTVVDGPVDIGEGASPNPATPRTAATAS
jgi:hypothetical protein